MEGDERKGAPTKRSYPNDLLPKWPWFSHEAWKTNTCAIPIFMLTRMCNCDQRHTTTGIASCCYPALIFGIICYTSSMAKPMSFHASFIRSLPIKTSKSPNKRERENTFAKTWVESATHAAFESNFRVSAVATNATSCAGDSWKWC